MTVFITGQHGTVSQITTSHGLQLCDHAPVQYWQVIVVDNAELSC